MICPECSAVDNRVIDSRQDDQRTTIRRRRHCNQCRCRWSTWEIPHNLADVRRDLGRLDAALVAAQGAVFDATAEIRESGALLRKIEFTDTEPLEVVHFVTPTTPRRAGS